MKGILFGGCSYTWGQGLYFYSDLPNLYNPPPNQYDKDKVTDAHIKFMETIRYPRLVSNHFKTFEVFKTVNGGSEDETFMFFHKIFNDKEKKFLESHVSYERYSYEDFSYIIIQLSQLYRNRFYFTINDEELWSNIPPNAEWSSHDNLLEWMEINNYSVSDWKNQLINQQYERLVRELKFYEDKGIKTRILSWEDDLLGKIKKDDFLSQRYINLEYNGEVFDTIQQLQRRYMEMSIEHDPHFKDIIYIDHHPSKLCHQIIANNIIKNIEKDLL